MERFLALPKLTLKVLWFPLLKYWIRQVETGRGLNRAQRRRLRTLKHHKHGYWVLAMDRTEWKGRNIFPHKRRYFQRGFHALSLIQQAL